MKLKTCVLIVLCLCGIVDHATAQPDGSFGRFRGLYGPPVEPSPVDDRVQRIMSLDSNNDGWLDSSEVDQRLRTLADEDQDGRITETELRKVVRRDAVDRGYESDTRVTDQELRESISRALPVIERASSVALKQRACYTCHNGGVTVLAVQAARRAGIAIDESNLVEQVERTIFDLDLTLGQATPGGTTPGQADAAGWKLMTLSASGWPADEVTERAVDYLIEYDRDKDHWQWSGRPRPPTVASPFTTTWVALSGILDYVTPSTEVGVALRVAEAKSWLVQSRSLTTEDSVSRLRSLELVDAKDDWIRAEARKLIRNQREDGGWAQLPLAHADAYATSTALAALYDTGQLSAREEASVAGLRYLLDSQLEDGTWHVDKRAPFLQPHFESSFPHDEDQFISAVATAWAVYAMSRCLPAIDEVEPADREALTAISKARAVIDAATFSATDTAYFTEAVEPILEKRCYECHSTDKQVQANLALNVRERIIVGGDNGPAALPGKAADSLLIQAITAVDDGELSPMPPHGDRLSKQETEILERWIELGLPHRH